MIANATDIAFAPMLPWWSIGALGAAALAAAGLAFARRASGGALRLLLSALLVAALLRPTLVSELREQERDAAIVLVDRSGSQDAGGRARMTDEALDALESRLDFLPHLDALIVETAGAGGPDRGTALLGALREAWAAVPRRQRAGAFLITDGQAHDAAAAAPAGPGEMGPVHVLLTGNPEEDGDRRLSVRAAPAYGIVGKDVEVELLVEDLGPEGAGRGGALVSVSADGRSLKTVGVVLGRAERIALPVDRAGATVFEFGVEPGPRELSPGQQPRGRHRERRAGPPEGAAGLRAAPCRRAGLAQPAEIRPGGGPHPFHDPASALQAGRHAHTRARADLLPGARAFRGAADGIRPGRVRPLCAPGGDPAALPRQCRRLCARGRRASRRRRARFRLARHLAARLGAERRLSGRADGSHSSWSRSVRCRRRSAGAIR